MNPRDFQPVLDEPLNRLFFAINHYVSTGDHFGEGVAITEGDMTIATIPVRRDSEQDEQDFAAFRSRFEQVATLHRASLGYMGEHGGFDGWTLMVPTSGIDGLARDLRRRPGALGWGSGKAIIDSHNWQI